MKKILYINKFKMNHNQQIFYAMLLIIFLFVLFCVECDAASQQEKKLARMKRRMKRNAHRRKRNAARRRMRGMKKQVRFNPAVMRQLIPRFKALIKQNKNYVGVW